MSFATHTEGSLVVVLFAKGPNEAIARLIAKRDVGA